MEARIKQLRSDKGRSKKLCRSNILGLYLAKTTFRTTQRSRNGGRVVHFRVVEESHRRRKGNGPNEPTERAIGRERKKEGERGRERGARRLARSFSRCVYLGRDMKNASNGPPGTSPFKSTATPANLPPLFRSKVTCWHKFPRPGRIHGPCPDGKSWLSSRVVNKARDIALLRAVACEMRGTRNISLPVIDAKRPNRFCDNCRCELRSTLCSRTTLMQSVTDATNVKTFRYCVLRIP